MSPAASKWPSAWLSMASSFRRPFTFPAAARAVQWFPRHMAKGLREMGRALAQADCIVEVHDARIGFSGRNEEFRRHLTGGRLPHILVLNKADLIPTAAQPLMARRLMLRDRSLSDVIFTNARDTNSEGLNTVGQTSSS